MIYLYKCMHIFDFFFFLSLVEIKHFDMKYLLIYLQLIKKLKLMVIIII